MTLLYLQEHNLHNFSRACIQISPLTLTIRPSNSSSSIDFDSLSPIEIIPLLPSTPALAATDNDYQPNNNHFDTYPMLPLCLILLPNLHPEMLRWMEQRMIVDEITPSPNKKKHSLSPSRRTATPSQKETLNETNTQTISCSPKKKKKKKASKKRIEHDTNLQSQTQKNSTSMDIPPPPPPPRRRTFSSSSSSSSTLDTQHSEYSASFSVGLLLRYLLSSSVPFPELPPAAACAALSNGRVPPIDSSRYGSAETAPAFLECIRLSERCISMDLSHRPLLKELFTQLTDESALLSSRTD